MKLCRLHAYALPHQQCCTFHTDCVGAVLAQQVQDRALPAPAQNSPAVVVAPRAAQPPDVVVVVAPHATQSSPAAVVAPQAVQTSPAVTPQAAQKPSRADPVAALNAFVEAPACSELPGVRHQTVLPAHRNDLHTAIAACCMRAELTTCCLSCPVVCASLQPPTPARRIAARTCGAGAQRPTPLAYSRPRTATPCGTLTTCRQAGSTPPCVPCHRSRLTLWWTRA